MQITFYHDADTDQPHILNHGVEEREVFEVFRRSPLHLHAKQGSMMALGQTAAGRYLKVIYRKKADEILVITAYDLRGKELIAYRRRRRRHQQ
jgi:uncharacterized DUF497 family protein